jgi:hypothetical protein
MGLWIPSSTSSSKHCMTGRTPTAYLAQRHLWSDLPVSPGVAPGWRKCGCLILCSAIILGTAHVISADRTRGGRTCLFRVHRRCVLVLRRRALAPLRCGGGCDVRNGRHSAERGATLRADCPRCSRIHRASGSEWCLNVMAINVWLFTYALVATYRAETRLATEVRRADGLLLAILPARSPRG